MHSKTYETLNPGSAICGNAGNLKRKTIALGLGISSAALLALGGCGGGDGGSNAGSNNGTAPTGSASALAGTAAVGLALANASVAVTNSSGNSPCVEATITTGPQGNYRCTLKAGEAAPFFVVVSGGTGSPQLVSATTNTPAPGSTQTLNATPLTTAILAQLDPAGTGDASAVVNGRSVNAASLRTVTANVMAQIGGVLTSIGAPTDFDPFSTSITAATPSTSGNAADQVLDVVKVVKNPATGKLALTTVYDTTLVPLADASGSGAQLSAPPTGTDVLQPTGDVLGWDCLQPPVQGAKSHVSASWIAPVQVDVLDVAGLGTQVLGGKAYPAIDVKNSNNLFFKHGDQHHVVYLHPQSVILPAAAVTYAQAGTGDTDHSYRFRYAAASIASLRAASQMAAMPTPPGSSPVWNTTAPAVVPSLAGLALGQSRTYTAFRQSANAAGNYPSYYDWLTTELTFTYQGRESVAAPDGTYMQACKVAVAGKVANAWAPDSQGQFAATVWLAPRVGPVRVSLTSTPFYNGQVAPAIDLFIPAAR